MEEKEQEKILMHQRKRRRHKIKLGVISLLLLLLTAACIITYCILSQNEYNPYTEDATVDYKVKLKENDFYEEEYLEENTNPIASLIENVETNFQYHLNLENEQEYTYYYKIIARTKVTEGSNTNAIYETTEELVSKEAVETNSKNLEISENVTINYNDYNEKINKFINLYHLNNTTSILDLELYVYATNQYDGQPINTENKVITLSIPLTTKTVDISIEKNGIQNEGEILAKRSEYQDINYVLWIGIALGVLGLIMLIRSIKYILDTRSAETMYDQQLKMILFNYKNYIQKTSDEVRKEDYKIIQINTFNEILGLRDTIQAPILMHTVENEDKTEFMIMKDGILYIYILGAKEIRQRLRMESAKKKEKQGKRKKQ